MTTIAHPHTTEHAAFIGRTVAILRRAGINAFVDDDAQGWEFVVIHEADVVEESYELGPCIAWYGNGPDLSAYCTREASGVLTSAPAAGFLRPVDYAAAILAHLALVMLADAEAPTTMSEAYAAEAERHAAAGDGSLCIASYDEHKCEVCGAFLPEAGEVDDA